MLDEYPVITTEMITPIDALVSTADAKRMYGKVMLQLGYLKQDEVSIHAEYLNQSIKDEIKRLGKLMRELKIKISDRKKELALENRITSGDIFSTEESKHLIQDIRDEIAFAEIEIMRVNKERHKLKKDKREFLINYINRELHG